MNNVNQETFYKRKMLFETKNRLTKRLEFIHCVRIENLTLACSVLTLLCLQPNTAVNLPAKTLLHFFRSHTQLLLGVQILRLKFRNILTKFGQSGSNPFFFFALKINFTLLPLLWKRGFAACFIVKTNRVLHNV